MHRKHLIASLSTLPVALLILVLSLRAGGYEVATQQQTAIVLWYSLFLGITLGLVRFEPQGRAALLALALGAGFAIWTGLSLLWTTSPDATTRDLDLQLLYLAVFGLALLVRRRTQRSRIVGGITLAMAAVVGLSALSRMLPALFPDGDVQQFLPDASARLSYPLGYWNALAAFTAMCAVLLVHAGMTAPRRAWRVAAWTWIPVASLVVFLTFARGPLVFALIGLAIYLTLASGWRALLAPGAVAAGGTAVLVAVASLSPELTDGLTGTDAARDQGLRLLLVTVVTLGISAAAQIRIDPVAGRRWYPTVRRPSLRRLAIGAATVAIVAVTVSTASGLTERAIDRFKHPDVTYAATPGAVQDRLSSGSSHGRYQFWKLSIDSFAEHPLLGTGAGTWEHIWARDGTLGAYVRNAHSFEMDVIAELGIVGLLLALGFLTIPLVAGVRRWRDEARSVDERATIAALIAVATIFALSTAVDWTWKLPAAGVVGVIALGLLVGPSLGWRTVEARAKRQTLAPPSLTTATLVVIAWLAICAELIPMVSTTKVESSQKAVRSGDLNKAAADARAAHVLAPWTAAPLVQLGLVYDRQDRYLAAIGTVYQGLAKEDTWRNWYAAWQVYRDFGFTSEASVAISQALARNPNSPILRAAEREQTR